MTQTIAVLLADDHATVREQLQALIDAQPAMVVVGVAADGREAVEQARTLRPDVVIMDISMPLLNGLEATANLHTLHPEIGVVILTAHQDHTYAAAAQAAGAHGYVLKHSPVEVLLAAVRAVATGGVFLDPALDTAGRPADPDIPIPPECSPDVLTEQERVVLQHTAQGLTSRETAGAAGIAVAEVVAIRSRAMVKLGLQGRVALARYAEQQGWR